MNPRSEPLLWLQLIGLGALPLEALLLLLLLAGSDPGRLPGLERLLTWAIGALLPAILLARQPADPFSLLLVTTPLRGRREGQRQLNALQDALVLKLGLGLGIAAALALLVWCDEHAAMAAAFSPLASGPRLVALLLAAVLLAVMVWQWQQVLQSLWLLSRSENTVAGATALSTIEIQERRLCAGLPLLLLEPLQGLQPTTPPTRQQAPSTQPAAEAAEEAPAEIPTPSPPEAQTEPETEPEPMTASQLPVEPVTSAGEQPEGDDSQPAGDGDRKGDADPGAEAGSDVTTTG